MVIFLHFPCPQGALPQRWQWGLPGADPPSAALPPAAGCLQGFSLSFIPKLHRGCNSVDLCFLLRDSLSTKRRGVRVVWVRAFRSKLGSFYLAFLLFF